MENGRTANDKLTKLTVDNFKFERMNSFKTITVTESGSYSEEMHAKIHKGNQAYFLY